MFEAGTSQMIAWLEPLLNFSSTGGLDMTSAVDAFLNKLGRTLSGRLPQALSAQPAGRQGYRIVAVKDSFLNRKLGRWLILSRLGQGAMSIVYKARDEITGQTAAVKIMRRQLLEDPSAIKRFQREARALSRLTHPNLIAVFDVAQLESGQPYFVMDFLEGRTLAQIIQEEGAIGPERVVSIFQQVSQAMEHAHAQGIIHRDLKPGNIMLVSNSEGRDFVKVVDFGIVKAVGESQLFSQRLTQTGEIWGTPVYMSPEQCMGKDLDGRSDIYSLGTVMYECLTGREVFQGRKITDIILKQLKEVPAAPTEVRPDIFIPGWLESIVLKALEKDPGQRFQSMSHLSKALHVGDVLVPSEQMPSTGRGFVSQAIEAFLKSDGQSLIAVPEGISGTAPPPGLRQEEALESEPDPFLQRTLGERYFVESIVGQGGMSVVYKARQVMVDRLVAVKMLHADMSADEACVKRFQREARAMSHLCHPHLITVHDVGVAPTGQPYYVMEYVEGFSLAEVLSSKGPLAPDRALPIFAQIAQAMDYAHRSGIIHRDLKPDNIMLIGNGPVTDFVKVVDLGIIKVMDDSPLWAELVSQKLTRTGQTWGSPAYMSPEQCLGQQLDQRSDIYSFGCLMYEVLSGHPVFADKKVTEVINRQVCDMPATFVEIGCSRQIPSLLEQTIFKCLHKDPRKRFQSMKDLIPVLQALPGSGGGSVLPKDKVSRTRDDKPSSSGPRSAGLHLHSALPCLALAVVALLVGIFIAWYLAKGSHQLQGADSARKKALETLSSKRVFPPAREGQSLSKKTDGRLSNSPLQSGDEKKGGLRSDAEGQVQLSQTGSKKVDSHLSPSSKSGRGHRGIAHHRAANTRQDEVPADHYTVLDLPAKRKRADDTYGYYDLKSGN